MVLLFIADIEEYACTPKVDLFNGAVRTFSNNALLNNEYKVYGYISPDVFMSLMMSIEISRNNKGMLYLLPFDSNDSVYQDVYSPDNEALKRNAANGNVSLEVFDDPIDTTISEIDFDLIVSLNSPDHLSDEFVDMIENTVFYFPDLVDSGSTPSNWKSIFDGAATSRQTPTVHGQPIESGTNKSMDQMRSAVQFETNSDIVFGKMFDSE